MFQASTLPRSVLNWDGWLNSIATLEQRSDSAKPTPLAWAHEYATLRTSDGRTLRYADVARDYQDAILADTSDRIIVLKSRQIGISQTVAFLAAHEARYGGTAVWISRTGEQAALTLDYVYTALRGDADCPAFVSENQQSLELANGGKVLTQPATRSAGRGIAATLVIIDEMAWQDYARLIYTSVLPMLAETGGRLVVLSTPNGRGNLFYDLWQQAQSGAWSCHLLPWTVHPVWRTIPGWREARVDELGEAGFAQEHDCDFVASGLAVFDEADIDAMWRLPALLPPAAGHRYVSGFDIGRRRDAFVGVTIDVSVAPFQMVAFERALHLPYPTQATHIAERVVAYPGKVLVESNGVGDPLIDFLTVKVEPFTTTSLTKRNAITALSLLLQRHELIAPEIAQLKQELLAYQWQDERLVQDCVMALAIAALAAGRPHRRAMAW